MAQIHNVNQPKFATISNFYPSYITLQRQITNRQWAVKGRKL